MARRTRALFSDSHHLNTDCGSGADGALGQSLGVRSWNLLVDIRREAKVVRIRMTEKVEEAKRRRRSLRKMVVTEEKGTEHGKSMMKVMLKLTNYDSSSLFRSH